MTTCEERKAPKITVRRATLKDYEAVLDINRSVYNCFDYIHHYYQELISDPDFSYYICEVDGEVGAFEGVCLLDDNASLMTRSAKVKDKFQGQGLLVHIRKKIYEDFENVPGKKNIRTCCTNMVRLVHSKNFLAQNEILSIKTLLGLNPLEDDLIIPPPYDTSIPGVSELTLDELGNIFDDNDLCSCLFPEGFLAVNSWFFKPLRSNLKHIEKQNVYSSVADSIKSQLTTDASSSRPRNQEAGGDEGKSSPWLKESPSKHNAASLNIEGLLGISGHYTTPSLLLYAIDIYGEPRQGREEEDYRQLLFHSLRYAASIHKGLEPRVDLSLWLSLRNDTYLEMTRKIILSIGFSEGEMTEPFTKHYYFEQNFEKLVSRNSGYLSIKSKGQNSV